jgi:hydroxyethylthiazole kinase-like uncharacterized protein yjeF
VRLLTAPEMQDLDRRTIEEVGIPGIVLMENAGRGTAEHICRRFGCLDPGPVVVLAGKGNNGGDGYVIARHLLNRNWKVRTIVLGKRESIGGDAAINLGALENSGGEVIFVEKEDGLSRSLAGQNNCRLIVDALFGTGLSSEVRGLCARAIEWINDAGAPVVAVDIPSGVDASTGRVLGCCVRADLTVTFAFPKVGHVVFPGAAFVGELVAVDIGIPLFLAGDTGKRHLLVEAAEAAELVPERPLTGHKGTFGHLLILAGSTGKTGAAAMTAEGGMRAGAGLVTVACPREVRKVLEVKLTEVMTETLPGDEGILSPLAHEEIVRLWAGKDSLAVGPGLGPDAGTADLLRRLVRECPIPLVVDADGLNALALNPEVLLERTGPAAILTPHPGEMARLFGGTIQEVETDRIGTARSFATRFRVVLVLKGARTVIAFPDGRVRINAGGNPGMASGGMGDVLTGLIGGLLAQGMAPTDASVLGVYLHGRAGDRLLSRLGDAGMAATDLLVEIPQARRELVERSR